MGVFEAILLSNGEILEIIRNALKKGVYLCAVKQNEVNEVIFLNWVL